MAIFITACSSKTQVHFYTNNLTQEKVNEIITTIDPNTFDVILNDLPYPSDINDNAIIYSPSRNSRERLNALMEVLSGLGFNISTASLISANNHSFTANNLGLYLFPKDYVQPELNNISNTYKIPLVNEYGATDCQHATVLYLKEPDEFIIEINQWDETIEDYRQEYIEGTWFLLNKEVLQLHQASWLKPLIFRKSNFKRSGIDDESKGVKFTPIDLGEDLKMLSEVYTDEAKAVYCTYSISLAL